MTSAPSSEAPPRAGASTLLTGISELVTNDPRYGPGLLGRVANAAVVIEGDRIGWVGPADGAPAADAAVDVGGRAVLPGWVDSHTHLVFGGDRAGEFAARTSGVPVETQGVLDTVTATRAATDDQLAASVRWHLAELWAAGTTCVETKTGYGLTQLDEVRSVAAARVAGVDEITFLGAHVVPPEYTHDGDGYLDLVCGPMLDAVAAHVGWIDVRCEDGAFDESQARRVMAAGQRAGLGLRVHGNQLRPGPGVRLAVDVGAASVDHCTFLADRDVEALAASNTVATLMPATDLGLRQPPPPGRALIDAGVTVALASGCNPGSLYSSSMSLAVGLGVLQAGLTVAEAVFAATGGGARALRRTDVGVVAPGARADLHVLNAPTHEYLPYRLGMPLTWGVWRQGQRLR